MYYYWGLTLSHRILDHRKIQLDVNVDLILGTIYVHYCGIMNIRINVWILRRPRCDISWWRAVVDTHQQASITDALNQRGNLELVYIKWVSLTE